ncbi:MAG: 4-alpha-glucanotransferase [Clostridia bacterium]|nr:4-alpha-glucanotransferase [Clostridia bacterium]
MQRQSGVLMPIFSLPNDYGIGSFGKESYKFVDFLADAGQKIWQILPLVQTGYGNSPYSSVSSESFNPYFISVDYLKELGLITNSEAKFAVMKTDGIDYGNLYAVRYPLLRKAFARFDKEDKSFKRCLKSKKFYDYALFMSIKYASGQKHFYEWEEGLRRREEKSIKKFAKDYSEEIIFWQFVQFIAEKEWLLLKKYANGKGISILGDMPYYVALDSVDVWLNPNLFKLDENFTPKKIAGVPPDYFSQTGQLWGNPVYDYVEHEKNGFSWWVNRIKKALSVYDYVRIDHFRAFDRYYEVDYGRENAIVGEWKDVPSENLFNTLHSAVDKTRIIAEDLGIIDDGVRNLLERVGYPGMKILSFAFNGEENNLYLPQNVCENSICYTGTHDNDTLLGLIKNASEWDKKNLKDGVSKSLELLGIEGCVEDDVSLAKSIISLGFNCKSKTFIIPLQDVLFKDTDFRINEPGTVKAQNWAVRFAKKDFKKQTANQLKMLAITSDRY